MRPGRFRRLAMGGKDRMNPKSTCGCDHGKIRRIFRAPPVMITQMLYSLVSEVHEKLFLENGKCCSG